MNIEALRYAQAVSRTKSFSSAARAYGVTQPALSNGVARLEEELGVKLFDRSPRGVKPTAHGARILPLIDRVLDDLDTLLAETQRLARPVTEAIRMGVSPLIGADLVGRAFQAARTLERPRDLVLREADLEPLRSELQTGRLDIVLVPAVSGMPTFRHRVIAREPVVVIDPAASGDDGPVELKAVADAAYILGPSTCGLTTFTTELFHSHDLALRTYPGEAASFRAVDEWAAIGLGAALLPRSKVTHEHASCRPLLRAGTPVEIAYEAVWDCDTPLGADLEELVTALTVAGEAPLVGPDPAPRGREMSEGHGRQTQPLGKQQGRHSG
ncbi:MULTISPECIES: LysR family transcriptional regulator [Streptomyces]|uniref:LysR family transcriptional regulator n=1 Tax=Streptomyces TaxID=1883 RepID=UPI000C3D5DD2|nr:MULTISPECIES: LysR family transcriptional regulator [Streptomyces]PIB00366.1 LysR family transcriptional regulator [Streptomyces sp. HG99]